MRRLFIAISLLTCLAATRAATLPAATSQPPPAKAFQQFLASYRQDPSALARFIKTQHHISPAQLNDAMNYLGVTHFSYLYPMVIEARDIASLKGVANRRLSLMAARGPQHQLIPIPFQIDEFATNGLIWIKGHNTAPADGVPGHWDGADELVFMYRDASRQRYDPRRDGRIKGHIKQEIKLTFPGSKPRWVYLVEDNPARSNAVYTHTDLQQGQISSTLYGLNYDPRDLLNINAITPKFGPLYGHNIFAGLKLHINSGVFSNYLRVNLGNNNFRITPLAVKNGPVRNVMLAKARVWYFGLPTFLDQRFMLNFYQQAINLPLHISPTSLKSLAFLIRLLRQPQAKMSLRLTHLDGASINFQSNPTAHRQGVVNGHMNDFEKHINDVRLPGDWLHINSHHGWQLFIANHLPIIPGGLTDRLLADAHFHLIYQDGRPQAAATATPLLTLGLAGQGRPQLLVALAGVIKQLDVAKQASLGDALITLSHKDSATFKAFDKVLNSRLKRLVASGFIGSVPQLSHRLLDDLRRLRLVGVNQNRVDKLIHDALVATTHRPDNIDTRRLLQKLVTLAQQRHIDLADLRYAVVNTTLWMPDQLGKKGAAGFNQQLKHPPSFVIHDYSPQGNSPHHDTSP